jgi:Ca2+-binding EF-hand superfamily protein
MKLLIPALTLVMATPVFAADQPKASEVFLQRFDADNNGEVSRDEFVKPHLQSINQQFDEMDMNRDGKVDSGEADAFAEMMRQRMQQMQQMHPQGGQPDR